MENEQGVQKETVFENRQLAYKNHAKLELTEAELELVREINRKAFFRKILPVVGGSMLTCQFLLRRGILSAKNSVWKISGAGVVGFMFARYGTYLETMRRLELEVPDGIVAKYAKIRNLSAAERQEHIARLIEEQEEQKLRVRFPSGTEAPVTTSVDVNTDYNTKNVPTGLDDNLRRNMTGLQTKSSQPSNEVVEPRRITSYTELREKSRSERHPQLDQLRERSPLPSSDSRTQPPVEEPKFFSDVSETPRSRPRGRQNQYGDEME